MRRAQLSLPTMEAAVGVLLVFAVTAGFLLGTPSTGAADRLDVYAADLGVVLADDGNATLAAVARSPRAFARSAGVLDARATRILPDGLLYRVTTAHGAVGYAVPDGIPVGVARRFTPDGAVTIRVWYA